MFDAGELMDFGMRVRAKVDAGCITDIGIGAPLRARG
jgi:hypothetical protein